MKIRNITIPNKPPRDFKKENIKIPFQKGLIGYYFYGSILTGLMLMVFSLLWMGPHEPGLITFKISASFCSGLIGFLMIKSAHKKYISRINAFKNGEILTGKIINHGRKFVPWKSFRDYTVTVEIKMKNSETNQAENSIIQHVIQSSRDTLHDELPVGSQTAVLFDGNSGGIFVPIEVGIEVSISIS
jgi:hypothetical protein